MPRSIRFAARTVLALAARAPPPVKPATPPGPPPQPPVTTPVSTPTTTPEPTPVTTQQTWLCGREYVNHAWGYQRRGVVVDMAGNVWRYDFRGSPTALVNPWQP